MNLKWTCTLTLAAVLGTSSTGWAYYPQRNTSGGKDIRNLQNRLNRAVDQQGQIVKGKAQKLVCKTQKKPVCYASKVVYERNFALVRVQHADRGDFFVLLHKKGKQWRARYAKSFKRLSLSAWRSDRAPVPEPVAKKLIAKLLGP